MIAIYAVDLAGVPLFDNFSWANIFSFSSQNREILSSTPIIQECESRRMAEISYFKRERRNCLQPFAISET